jgi:hypothetical protein
MARSYGEEAFLKLNILYNDDFKLYCAKGCANATIQDGKAE